MTTLLRLIFLILPFVMATADTQLHAQQAVATPSREAQSSGGAVRRDIMVPMRDGVRLATDLHLPTADGKAIENETFPTILTRLPYSKNGCRGYAPYFA